MQIQTRRRSRNGHDRSDDGSVRPDDRRDPLRRWAATALLTVGLVIQSTAALSLEEATEQLLIEAVEAAYAVDLYHARCRSDGSNRRTENLNKLLASRMRMTVLRVQDDVFPERNYRKVQERLQRDFLAMLAENGGCAGVKDSELPAELRARYDEKMRAIEALP